MSPPYVLEQCYSKFTLQLVPVHEWLSGYEEISTESESKHLKTFRAI